ncbi:hypothetical protein PS3A_54560 [Pseudomonas sp. 3A(2025)]
MDREGIKQRVFDALGIILVDKSQIHEDSTFEELVLDDDDVHELFKRLEHMFACRFPGFIRQRANRRPDHVSLPMLVDLIVMMQQEADATDKSAHKTAPDEKRRS